MTQHPKPEIMSPVGHWPQLHGGANVGWRNTVFGAEAQEASHFLDG